MTHEFRLPDIGEGLTEADIIEWFVDVGDDVAVDQAIVEIETAKTTVEITATVSGTIVRLAGSAGDTVTVGDVLFVIGDDSSQPTADSSQPTADSSQPSTISRQQEPVAVAGHAPTRTVRVRAMPIIRKLAKERGIDLASITGTGPGGAVTREDIDGAVDDTTDADLEPMTSKRRAIARHMSESWATIPHVSVQADVRAESMLDARDLPDGRTASLESIVGLAVMPLLKRYREFNAVVRGDAVEYREHCNLGIAVDTDGGLMVVVVRDSDALSPPELDAEIARLAEAAKAGTLSPDEAIGQTFTISNIGALGGGHGTPIIPMGTSAILSVGRARQVPVVDNGEIAVGLVAPIDLSYDHRLIDGSLGQRFLSDLVQTLESPRP
ncbi:MAG: dihydrolipoamide acetyltransferase family protein [Actinomycetota bacterium]